MTVTFPAPAPASSGGSLYLFLEDITYADAPAEIVAAVILRDVSVPPADPLEATLRVARDRIQETAHYSVRAHLDADGDGQISVGDWISPRNHPVLTRGYPTRVSVPLKRVA